MSENLGGREILDTEILGVNFRRGNILGAKIHGVNFRGEEYSRRDLPGVDIRSANLLVVNFINYILSEKLSFLEILIFYNFLTDGQLPVHGKPLMYHLTNRLCK